MSRQTPHQAEPAAPPDPEIARAAQRKFFYIFGAFNLVVILAIVIALRSPPAKPETTQGEPLVPVSGDTLDGSRVPRE